MVHRITKGNIDMEKQAWQINSDKKGPHVLLLAGVHGDEYEPMVALAELAGVLRQTIHRGRVTIDPLVNTSAYERSSRFGDDGLDLARICPGSETGSSSERAAHAVSARIRAADVVIDLHTGGIAMEIFPLVGYMLHSDPVVLEQQRQLAVASGMPLIWGTDVRPDGRTLSVARDAGVPAIYMEYGGGSGFRQHVADQYKETVKRILGQLGMYVPAVQSEGWHYWLEDHRRDSGYLQAKMPAPQAGIFVAEVAIGDWVTAGQRFGRIVDPYNGQSTTVYAADTGLVFLLRSAVKVQQGEALGGVMAVKRTEKISIQDGEGSNH